MQKNKINILEKITDIYIVIIIIVFPLIVNKYGFFRIFECKYNAFLAISITYLVSTILAYLFMRIVKKEDVLKDKKITLVQIGGLVFLGANIISCIFSPFKNTDFFLIGIGRAEGIITISLYTLTFLAITAFGEFKKRQILYFSISSILLNLIAILQFVGFNPFNMYQEGIGTHNVSFMTTIGNVDFISALYCILVAISAFAYIYMDNNKYNSIIHLLSVAMGSFILNIIDVNSGKVAFLGLIVLAFPFIITNSKRLKKSVTVVNMVMIANCINVIMNTQYHYDLGRIVLHFQFNYIVFLFIVVIAILALLARVLKNVNYDISDNKKVIRGIYLLYLVGAIVIIAFFYFVDLRIGMLSEIHEILHGNLKDEYGTYRVFLWRRTLKIIPEAPLIGTGPDTFVIRFMSKYTEDIAALGELSINDTAANAYLTMIVNIGILGFGAYLFMLFASFKEALHFKAKNLINENKEAMVLLSGITCYLIQDFFNLWVVVITPVYFVTLGVLYLSTKESKKVE